MPNIDINSNVPRLQFTAASSQTVFSLNFILFNEEDVVVVVDGVTQTLTTDYSVTDLETEDGATITFVTPLIGGELVTISRDSVISRISKYQQGGRFNAAPLERDLDVVTTVLQELSRDISRSVKLNVEDSLLELNIPTASTDKILAWNVAADEITNSTKTLTEIENGIDSISALSAGSGVLVSSNDTTVGYLNGKLIAGDVITFTENNDGANETLTLSIPDDSITTAKILDSNITKSKIEDLTNMTVLGNTTGTAGTPTEVIILDEDDMSSDSATSLASQQSIKAYIDNNSGITLGTTQTTTSGTAFDFTGIPSGTKRITVSLNNVGLTGTDDLLIQLGDSGGIEATGYVSLANQIAAGGVSSSTIGFVSRRSYPQNSTFILSLIDSTNNTWQATLIGANSASGIAGNGVKSLSAELTQLRLTRSGTNTFNSGSINISYE